MIGMILGIAGLILPLVVGSILFYSGVTTYFGIPVITNKALVIAAAVVSFLGLITSIAGLLLSVFSMKELKMQGQPAGMAIAGLICSITAIVFSVSCTGCFVIGCVGAC